MKVAARQGSGNVSLDAVAAEAGVSKGGLLYHFPSKIALMRGIVATFVADFEAKLEAARTDEQLIEAYVNLTVEDCARQPGDSAAILTALA